MKNISRIINPNSVREKESVMSEKILENKDFPSEQMEYDAPRIIQKQEIVIELQTNYIPDEPPPPL